VHFFGFVIRIHHYAWASEYQTLFRIRLRQILLKYTASFFIWYPKFLFYSFSFCDTDSKKTARLCVWEEMWVSIRQATCCSVYGHCCRHFTHQVDIRIDCMHTVLIRERSFL